MTKTAISILLLIALLLGAYWWSQQHKPAIDPALLSVVRNYALGADGIIQDPTGALGIESKEDVYFTRNKKELSIYYGKQQFIIDIDGYGDEVSEYLRKLGISIYSDKQGSLVVKFKGEAVTEYE